MNKKEETPEIVTIFWDNVEWHIEKKISSGPIFSGETLRITKGKERISHLEKFNRWRMLWKLMTMLFYLKGWMGEI